MEPISNQTPPASLGKLETLPPASVAKALRPISSYAFIAQMLTHSKFFAPERYHQILFFMDLYNPPGVPNPRDRVEALLANVHFTAAQEFSETEKEALTYQALGLLARAAPDNDWLKAKNIVRPYESFAIAGAIIFLGEHPGIDIYIAKNIPSPVSYCDTIKAEDFMSSRAYLWASMNCSRLSPSTTSALIP